MTGKTELRRAAALFWTLALGACGGSEGRSGVDTVVDAGTAGEDPDAQRDAGSGGGRHDAAEAPPGPDAVIVPPAPDAAIVPADAAIVPPPADAAIVPPPADAAIVPPVPDAAIVPPPDALVPDALVPDALVPDALAPDAQVPDALLPDALLPDALPPPEGPAAELLAPCRGGEAVSVFGRTAFAGPAGFYLEFSTPAAPAVVQPLSAFEAGDAPIGLAARPVALGGPAFFLALQRGPDCVLEARALAGELSWTQRLPDTTCRRPLLMDDRLYVAVDRPASSALLVLAADDGAARRELPVAGRWGAAPVRAGHQALLAATESALLLVDTTGEPPTLAASLALPGVWPATLTLLDANSLAVLGRTDPGVDGLGDALLRVAVDVGRASLVDLGAPLLLPGGALASPVGGGDCASPIANGGSHWYCPGGVVVTGGDGWLRGHRFDDGSEIVTYDPPAMRVTGLTLTRDGRIMNGGSHWLPGAEDYTLEVLRANAGQVEVEAFARGPGPAGACLGSPVVESDGLVTAALVSRDPGAVLVRQSSFLSGLAPAWSRGASGDALGTGAAVDPAAPCPGGEVALGAHTIEGLGVAAAFVVEPDPAGGIYTGGMVNGPNGFDAWIAAFDARGYRRFTRTLANPTPGEHEVMGLSVDADGLTGAFDTDLAGVIAVRVVRLDSAGEIVSDVTPPALLGRLVREVRALGPGRHGILTRTEGAPFPGPTHALVTVDDAGDILDDLPITLPVEGSLQTFRPLPDGGYVLVGATELEPESRAAVYVLDAAGSVVASDLALTPNVNRMAGDAVLRDDGGFGILGYDQAGPDVTWLRFYGPGGVFESEVALGVGRPAVVLPTPEGYAVALDDLRIVRTNASGGVIEAHDYSGAAPILDARAMGFARQTDGAFVMSGYVVPAATGVPRGYLVATDVWGNASCGGAGLCVGVAPEACTPRSPCETGECEPTTGLCAYRDLDDGTPCGSGLLCLGGACQ